MVAQQLYEGIDLGPGEPTGLITYMRTDSTRIAAEAAQEAISLVRERFGAEYAMDQPRFFKNRKKVQDAHEAIRPTSVINSPEKVTPYLSKDQAALYRLIWRRFVASQMKPALIDQNTLSIDAGAYTFTATGSSVKFPGFMALYMSVDEETEQQQQKKMLPPLSRGTRLNPIKLEPRQHFTMPPPRFSEASLVKELEENGIGRPSTYAAILSTIREKGYVDLVKGYFRPNELGFIVNDLIVASFPDIFDVAFTAKMEEDLDRVETSEVDALEILNRFYNPFKKELDTASDEMLSVKGVGLPTDLRCPSCQKTLHIKVGKNGHFLACSGYPQCSYSSDYTRDEKGHLRPVELPPDEISDRLCPHCGRPMIKKHGKYGSFLACSGYPQCTHTESVNANHNGPETGVGCPQPECDGMLVQKTSKRGKIFYGCNRFPKCTFALWDKPLPQACPQCGHPYLLEKSTKREGRVRICPSPDCNFREPIVENQQNHNENIT